MRLFVCLLIALCLAEASRRRSGNARRSVTQQRRTSARSDSCRGGTKLEHLKGECMLHYECLEKKGMSIGPCFTTGVVGTCCMVETAAKVEALATVTPGPNNVFKTTRSPNAIPPEREKPPKRPNGSSTTTKITSASTNFPSTPSTARPNATAGSVFDDAHDFWVSALPRPSPSPATVSSTLPTPSPVSGDKATPNKIRCGIRPLRPTGRVVGGRNAKVGEWPWHVLIKEAGFLGLFMKPKCGGVLIDDRWVLTAAHCQPSVMGSLVVMLGQHDMNARNTDSGHKTQIKTVKRMIVHRDYNPETFDNDIALLELDQAFEMQPNVVPICLPEADHNLVGLYGHVSGFGKLSYGGIMPNVLQTVKLPVIANEKCQKMFADAGHYKFIGSNFICAGYPQGGKDSCEGDSGGPFMMEIDGHWTLVGTVSHGIKCAEPNMPGVYMKTYAYLNWIKSVIGKSTNERSAQ